MDLLTDWAVKFLQLEYYEVTVNHMSFQPKNRKCERNVWLFLYYFRLSKPTNNSFEKNVREENCQMGW